MGDPILRWTQSKQKEIIAFVREMVECESPSDDAASIARFAELFSDCVSDIGKVRLHKGSAPYGPHLHCEFQLPGRGKQGQILALGHSDTVYPLGTLGRMPFREQGGRLWGPGVLDMKGGVALFVFAMRALRELDIPVRRKVLLQLNSDEEIGSPSSRPLTEKEAQRSVAVLVLEPGTGLTGKAKTARKGVGDYTVTVRGKEAHAGLDFTCGASAILELGRQIEVIAGFTNLERGLTVNPGVISGGTRSNVIAGLAQAEIDFRITRAKDAVALDKQFRKLKAFDKRCTVDVTGGLNRPPMERTPGVVQLFKQAQKLAADLGVQLEESMSGGGSDGNFTAGLGVPTLDGIGMVGEGAHAPTESVLIDRIADRTALLAKLVATI
ncbi:MAG TPA: M20 family metallopeptidase [Bryobacteraceae bacterium]|nr:M20 family metallopeptidase [Bryobacteraceae bacterium]